MRAAMSNIAWSPDERISAYRLLASVGITGLEIAPGLLFHAADDPFEPEERVAQQAMAEVADAGLTLVSMQSLLFGLDRAGLFDGEEGRARFEAGMRRAIELAGRFGVPNVVFGSPKHRRVPEPVAMERALAEATEVFRRLGDAAQSAGTKIAIEPNPVAYGTNFLNTLDEALDFVDRTDHPAIVSILDLGAMRMNGSYETVPEVLPGCMTHLHHVHVSESNLAPAPADVSSLVPVLRALEAHGYDKAVSIEMKRPGDGLAGVETAVKRLVAAFDAQGNSGV